MKEYGKIVFKDLHEESIVAYVKVYDIDPTKEIIIFKTETNEYIWKPLSEEEIEFQINYQDNFLYRKDHAFYFKKDGQLFCAEDISFIKLY